jgi:hypothetical protein
MRSNVTGTALCAMRDGVFYRGEDLAVEAGLSVTQARAVLGRLSRGGRLSAGHPGAGGKPTSLDSAH